MLVPTLMLVKNPIIVTLGKSNIREIFPVHDKFVNMFIDKFALISSFKALNLFINLFICSLASKHMREHA